MYVDGAGIAVVFKTPYLVQQLVAGEYPVGMAGQIIQKLQFLGRRVHYLAVHLQLIARQVHRELIIADDAVRLGLGGRAAAQHGFDARHHFLGVERLYYIVVRTQLQAEHLVEGLAFSREHDNGCVVRRADAAAHLPAVHSGHHDIKKNQCNILFFIKKIHGFLTISCFQNLKAFFGQEILYQLPHIGFRHLLQVFSGLPYEYLPF